jgi:superfamily I DNA and RNA helicase
VKILKQINPTAEQLKLVTHVNPGVRIIRGSAGSGKTSTAALMLKTALGYQLDKFRSKRDP